MTCELDWRPAAGLYAALLTPQGKILFDFLVTEGDGALLLDCAADHAEALLKKLTMYRLRAKIEIDASPATGGLCGLEGHPEPAGLCRPRHQLPRSQACRAGPAQHRRGGRDAAISWQARAAYHADAAGAWACRKAGDFGSDKIFALDAGLDELHGVSFDKGLLCRPGIDLADEASRARRRKRILPVTADAPLPAARHRRHARRHRDWRNDFGLWLGAVLPWCGWTGWMRRKSAIDGGEIAVRVDKPGMAGVRA